MALFARLVRGTMLETLQQDYVRTARAKGLRYRRVVGLHVLRNSLIPVVTAAGPLLGYIITGSFVIELIFNIPGHRQLLRHRGQRPRLLGRHGPDGSALRADHHREPRRRHPLRSPRSPHAGRARLMAANPTDIRDEGLIVEGPGPVRGADPPDEPLEGRLVSLHAEQGSGDRRRRLCGHPPLLPARPDLLAVRPRCGELREREAGSELRPPLRHGQVRARPLRAHGSRRPRLDPDRVRRHDRDPRDRRRLRVDLRVRRRPA